MRFGLHPLPWLPAFALLAACGSPPIGSSLVSPGEPIAGSVRPSGAPVRSAVPSAPDPLERVAALERAAAERTAAERAEAERVAAERAAAEEAARKAEAERQAAEEAQRRRIAERAARIEEARRIALEDAANGVPGVIAALPARTEFRASAPLRVGPGHPIRTIAEAARLAKDGDTVEVQAGQYRGEVAVWTQKQLTIKSVGGRAVLIGDGRSAEGKGIWVVRGGDVTIEGFDFVGARVPDGNGAGIRFDSGRLTVRDVRFIDNQVGLLTGNDRATELTIERCEFAGPSNGNRHHHNLYVGAIARLVITGSWLHSARAGHLLKSRARENHVRYNRLTDEGGNGSYELEFPVGGVAWVVGNLIEQSPRTENAVIVSFGAEGYAWPENRLAMSHNTVVNRRARGGTFVRVSPGAAAPLLVNNIWVGSGGFVLPANAVEVGNRRLRPGAFAAAARHDYRVASPRSLAPVQAPANVNLRPDAEYSHPRGLRRLDAIPILPGAFQP